MITYVIVLILIGLVSLILAPLTLLPDVALPVQASAAIATMAHNLWIVANVIPFTLSAIVSAVIIVLGIETKIFSYKTIKWLYNKIPGVN